MPSERWQQIEAIYHAALECEPAERVAFLAKACAGDDALRDKVTALIAYDDTAKNFIEQPALEMAAQTFVEEQTTLPLQLQAGQEIGAYQLQELLGRGGMGEVYLALDTRLQRKVAIKLLPARFTTDADRVRRFAQEARAASALNHPNILTIHEIGEVEDTHYIVTEYVAGETLRQRITNAPNKQLPLTEAIAVATQIAEALAAAHKAGIVHRDIKPENVMVRPDGYIKVLDFGLAKLTETQSVERGTQNENSTNADRSSFRDHLSTASGIVMGTPRYMSPEQARGEKVDARSDLFSLGVLLYEMIVGGAPFTGATPGEVIAALLRDEPLPLTAFAPDTPLALQQIVNRALRKDREARYQTTNDLLADLKRLPQEPDFLRQDRKRSDAVTKTSEEKLIGSSTGATTGFRRMTVLGILIPLLLVFIGSGVWLYFKREKSDEIERLEFKGNFYLGRWSEDEIRKGIEYYNQAIALDPKSASAYEGLAQGWGALSDLYLSPREAMPKAQAAITKALQIKETSAATHVTLALIKAQYDWDWTGAEQELQRAIALDPDYNSAHQVYGWYLIGRGRLTEAQAEMKQALGADPLNDFGLWGLGDSFYFAHQYEAAIEQYRRAIGVNPRSHWLHLMLGWAYEQKGSFVEAFAEFNKAGRLNDIPQVQAALGRLQAVSGQRTEAQAVLAELQETARHKYVSPYDIAALYVGLGETETALVWLEKAYEERSGWMALWIKVDPRFKSLHDDARFQKLLQRIGLA